MRVRSFSVLIWSLPLLYVLSNLQAANAQTYTIKPKHYPDVGKSFTERDTETVTNNFRVADPSGKALKEDKSTVTTEEVSTLTVLEKGDKHPNKYKRTFEKASKDLGGKAVTEPYQGRTIIYELKDGKYQVSAEGQPALTDNDLAPLVKKANDQLKNTDDVFLPGKPIKEGETWVIDAKKLVDALNLEGADVDVAKSKAEGKLVKAYQKDGKQNGVIEMNITVALKSMKDMPFEPGAVFELKGTVDGVIDGSSTAGTVTMKGGLKGKSGVEKGTTKITLDLNVEMSGKKETSAEK